jgi:hypothetical protein
MRVRERAEVCRLEERRLAREGRRASRSVKGGEERSRLSWDEGSGVEDWSRRGGRMRRRSMRGSGRDA